MLSREEAQRLSQEVDSSLSFRLNDGGEVKSLRELYSVLKSCSDEVFAHHVNGSRNDFSTWIKDVHNDSHLSNLLTPEAAREAAVAAVGKRLYDIEKALAPEGIVETSFLLPMACSGQENNSERFDFKLEERLDEKPVETLADGPISVSSVSVSETKSPLKVFVDDVSLIFNKDSFRDFKADMSSIFSSHRKQRERMIDSLKKVYK